MRIPSFIALAILAFGSFVAQAQVPLKIITTDQAGGGMDALIRPVAEKLSVALGRPVLVDNKPGAQGRIGGQAVVSSPPDGNTVLITVQAGIVINPHVYPWPYNSLADLLPVSDLGRGSLVLLAPANTPAANIKELAAWIKAQPKGKVNYGTYSPGTISHFGGQLLAQELGTDMTPVHYKASGDQVKDLVGGVVSLGWGPAAGSVTQLIKAGRLKAYAYMGPKRLPALPDVPTVSETLPGFDATGWFGVFAPKGTSVAVADRLAREMAAVLADPAVRQRIEEIGGQPIGLNGDQLRALVMQESARWKRVCATVTRSRAISICPATTHASARSVGDA